MLYCRCCTSRRPTALRFRLLTARRLAEANIGYPIAAPNHQRRSYAKYKVLCCCKKTPLACATSTVCSKCQEETPTYFFGTVWPFARCPPSSGAGLSRVFKHHVNATPPPLPPLLPKLFGRVFFFFVFVRRETGAHENVQTRRLREDPQLRLSVPVSRVLQATRSRGHGLQRRKSVSLSRMPCGGHLQLSRRSEGFLLQEPQRGKYNIISYEYRVTRTVR